MFDVLRVRSVQLSTGTVDASQSDALLVAFDTDSTSGLFGRKMSRCNRQSAAAREFQRAVVEISVGHGAHDQGKRTSIPIFVIPPERSVPPPEDEV